MDNKSKAQFLQKKSIRVIVADRPSKLEFLVNAELENLFNKEIKVLDIQYAISKDVGSVVVVYESE